MVELSPVNSSVVSDQLKSEVMRASSPTKLIVGGRAIFIMLARNHHDVKVGVVSCIPCIARSVRVWVRS